MSPITLDLDKLKKTCVRMGSVTLGFLLALLVAFGAWMNDIARNLQVMAAAASTSVQVHDFLAWVDDTQRFNMDWDPATFRHHGAKVDGSIFSFKVPGSSLEGDPE